MDNFKEVKLHIVDKMMYLVSNDELFRAHDICLIPKIDKDGWDKKTYIIDNPLSNYMVLQPNEFSAIKKVIAGPDQIGFVYGIGTNNEINGLHQIPETDITKIFENGGRCWIEYLPAENKPKFINNQVIIHLKENIISTDIVDTKYVSCPCLYLKEPCQKHCTCVSPFMSHGCLNCATYGSIEQKREMAEKLNEYRLFYMKNKPETFSDKIKNVLEHLKLIVKMEELKEQKDKAIRAQKYDEGARLRGEEKFILDKINLLKPIEEETIKELFYTHKR